MVTSQLFGFSAAVLSTVAFLPQVVKTWRTKKADDVSYALLLTFSAGCICWGIYGFQVDAKPVLFANSLTLILNLAILAMKMLFSTKFDLSK